MLVLWSQCREVYVHDANAWTGDDDSVEFVDTNVELHISSLEHYVNPRCTIDGITCYSALLRAAMHLIQCS
jgi:hypothetical protein